MTASTNSDSALTVLDHLDRASARPGTFKSAGRNDQQPVLWTDPKAEWNSVIPTIQTRLDELLVLGTFDPEMRTGPGNLDPMSRRPDTRRTRAAR